MRGGAAATLLALAALGGAERREPPSFSEFMHASLSIAQLRELDALMGWSSLSDAARVKHFRSCDERSAEGEALAASGLCPSLGSAASMLELGAAKPWRSRYAFQSKLLTEDQMSDAITRVQRWDGLTLDPQAAWRSGYLNASGYYEAPYILGYTGPIRAIGGRPSDTATAAATAVATATAGTATATSGAGTDGDGETSAAIAGPGDTDTASATASAVATASATATDTATDGSTDTASATATATATTDGDTAAATADSEPNNNAAADNPPTGGTGSATSSDRGDSTGTKQLGDGVVIDSDSTPDVTAALGDEGQVSYDLQPSICLLQVPPSARCRLVARLHNASIDVNGTAAEATRAAATAAAPTARSAAVNATLVGENSSHAAGGAAATLESHVADRADAPAHVSTRVPDYAYDGTEPVGYEYE